MGASSLSCGHSNNRKCELFADFGVYKLYSKMDLPHQGSLLITEKLIFIPQGSVYVYVNQVLTEKQKKKPLSPPLEIIHMCTLYRVFHMIRPLHVH